MKTRRFVRWTADRPRRALLVEEDGQQGVRINYTHACVACMAPGQMGDRSPGCRECGYTGKRRRQGVFVSLDELPADREFCGTARAA